MSATEPTMPAGDPRCPRCDFRSAIQERVCRWVARRCRPSSGPPLTHPGRQRPVRDCRPRSHASATFVRLSAMPAESSATQRGRRRGGRHCRWRGQVAVEVRRVVGNARRAVNKARAVGNGVNASVRPGCASADVAILNRSAAPASVRRPLPAATRSFSIARGALFVAHDDSSRARVSPLTPVTLSCLSMPRRRWSLGRRRLSIPRRPFSIARRRLSRPCRRLLVPRRRSSVGRRRLSISRGPISMARRRVSMRRPRLSVAHRRVSVPRRRLWMAHRRLSMARPRLSMARRRLSMPRRRLHATHFRLHVTHVRLHATRARA